MNLPPIVDLIAFVLWPLFFPTSVLNFLKALKTSKFSFKKYIQNFLLKSSIKSKKIFILTKRVWSQTSAWISSKGFFTLVVSFFGKLFLACYPSRHPSHDWFGWSIEGIHLTIFFLPYNFNPLKLRCSNLNYQIQDKSLTQDFMHFTISFWIFNKNILFLIIGTLVIKFTYWSLIERLWFLSYEYHKPF